MLALSIFATQEKIERWKEGVIQSVKGGFYNISFCTEGDKSKDEVPSLIWFEPFAPIR